jgi:excisionase family DNA binding protein
MEGKEFWTLEEVAKLFRIGKECIRRKVIGKRIHAVKVGKSWLVENAVVEDIKKHGIK